MQEFQEINNCRFFTISNNKDSDTSVLIIHGYAEHILRYQNFYNTLDAQGYNVMGYDHRGHGQTDGKRAMIKSFDVYVEDMHAVVKQFFKPGKNNFIFGHSMGGLIVTMYLEKYGSTNITGVITSGAALAMYNVTPPFLEKIAGTIANIFPNLPTVGPVADIVSRDKEVVERYKNDPLIYMQRTKAKMGHEFLKAQRVAEANLDKISVPMFINHGSGDVLIDPNSSQIIYDKVSSEDKTLKMWEGLYHEILNEPEKDEVMKEIIAWIKSRSK